MKYSLRFHPEVEDDVLRGYTWYETRSPGLGEEFLRTFYRFAEEIPRNPLRYPKVYGAFRRRIMKKFPYAIYFQIKNNLVIVIGLFHCARDPRVIDSQLEN